MEILFQNQTSNNVQIAASKAATNLIIGLDVHLKWIVATIQEGHLTPKSPRKFKRQELIQQIQRWKEKGYEIYCVQEACGFGYTFHQQLQEAGAKSFVIRPIVLNSQQRRRKNDKIDSLQLCLRLSRYIDGNKTELSPIRIPNVEEQQRREVSRRREFLQKQIRQLDNRGRALLLEHCHETLPSGWWGPRKWKWHCENLDSY